MLNEWWNLLPLFMVKRIARKRGETFTLGGAVWAQATDGVLVLMLPKDQSDRLSK